MLLPSLGDLQGVKSKQLPFISSMLMDCRYLIYTQHSDEEAANAFNIPLHVVKHMFHDHARKQKHIRKAIVDARLQGQSIKGLYRLEGYRKENKVSWSKLNHLREQRLKAEKQRKAALKKGFGGEFQEENKRKRKQFVK